MKTIVAVLAVGLGAAVLAQRGGGGGGAAGGAGMDSSVETYEHLATAIIALRQTEDGLVKGILMHYKASASRSLAMAAGADGADRKASLERAATQITHIANEGDKPIQAVKQRLLKAGHTHHTDADSGDDYLWISTKEKKQLVDLAQKVSKMGADTSADDIKAAGEELTKTFDGAIAPE